MKPSATPTRSTKRTYKLHGPLVGVDLLHQRIVIQPSKQDGTRVRRLIIRSDSEIIAGTERRVLADLIADVGEWVNAHYVNENHWLFSNNSFSACHDVKSSDPVDAMQSSYA